LSEGQEEPRYRIELTPAAVRDLKGLAWTTLKRVDSFIRSLAENPRPHGAKKLKGVGNLYRGRVGDYRIIYEINDEILLVTVARIRHRRDVYRG
jgi:mRNA interferase RelE/StbE